MVHFFIPVPKASGSDSESFVVIVLLVQGEMNCEFETVLQKNKFIVAEKKKQK